ncbi:MAG: P22 phage major capsid protein family protein [Nitrosomonadaceae bacterium]
MAALTAGKIADVMFEDLLETIDDQTALADKCERFEPDASTMQNSNNAIWRPVEQQSRVVKKWDMAGEASGIIQETYPSTLGLPSNTMVEMRADELRDLDFWRRQGARDGRQMVVEQNTAIAQAIVDQGSLFYRSAATDGFSFLSEAQVIMNEQQRFKTDRHFYMNDRTNQKFGKDLAGRQTLQGRPEEVWSKGQIGTNIAEFDSVNTASFLPSLAGGSDAATVVGNQSFRPEGGTVTATGIVTNVDYRYASIPTTLAHTFEIGDKFTLNNGGTDILAVGSSTKQITGEARTFTVVGVPDDQTIEFYPKPIALDDTFAGDPDAALMRKSANIDTLILAGANIVAVNTDALAKTNIFFDTDAVEIVTGTIPANLFAEYNGHKVISSTMKNGQPIYMIYDADMVGMNLRYRVFSWWDVVIKDPMRAGVAISI